MAIRVVLWDDDRTHLKVLRANIQRAANAAGLNVTITEHRSNWHRHALEEPRFEGAQVWLVDLQTAQQSEKSGRGEFAKWTQQKILADATLSQLYEQVSDVLKGDSHNGVGIAIAAREAKIPFRVVSRFDGLGTELMRYLATGSLDPVDPKEWSFNKDLLTAKAYDLPAVSAELNRVVAFLREHDPDTILSPGTAVADGKVTPVPPLPATAPVAVPHQPRPATDEPEGASLGTAQPSADSGTSSSSVSNSGQPSRRSSVWRWCWGCLVVLGVPFFVAMAAALFTVNSESISDFFDPASRELKDVRVYDFQSGNNVARMPADRRQAGLRLRLKATLSKPGRACLVKFNPDGTVEIVRRWRRADDLVVNDNSGDLQYAAGFHLLVVAAVRPYAKLGDSQRRQKAFEKLRMSLENNWKRDCGSMQGRQGHFEYHYHAFNEQLDLALDGAAGTLPSEIQRVVDCLKAECESNDIDDAYIVGFLVQ